MATRLTMQFTGRRSSVCITTPQQRSLTLVDLDDIAKRRNDAARNQDVREQYGDTTKRCKTLIDERRLVYQYHNNGRLQWRAGTILLDDAFHTAKTVGWRLDKTVVHQQQNIRR